MASIFMPSCPLTKNLHLLTRPTGITRRSTVFLRAAARMESSAAAGDAASSTGENTEISATDTVVQYVVLRRDLIDTWPMGSVVTQGCHASVAAIWLHKDDADTLLYCSPSNLDSMHKVTLEVKGEAQMLNLSEKLKAGGIAHKLWIEQPENIPTCLATKPYPKSSVSTFFKKLKLCDRIDFAAIRNQASKAGKKKQVSVSKSQGSQGPREPRGSGGRDETRNKTSRPVAEKEVQRSRELERGGSRGTRDREEDHEGPQSGVIAEAGKKGARASGKRPRVEVEVPETFRVEGGKGMFTYGINRDGKESFWDVGDPGLALMKTDGLVSDYDRGRLVGRSSGSILELMGGDLCRAVAGWKTLVEQEKKTREIAEELRSQVEALSQDLAEKVGELEVKQTECDKLNHCYDQLKEKYETEKKSGKRFLESEHGATYRRSIEDFVERRYRESDECRAMIHEHAATAVYTPLVRLCRQYLRDVGGIDESIIRGMEADILDEGEEEEDEGQEAGGDTEIAGDADAEIDADAGTTSACDDKDEM